MNEITCHFPSREASKEEKSEMSYGLRYAKAIYDAYTKDVNSLYNKKEKFVRNRKYAEGTHSIDKFKGLMGLNGDQSYLNLDFSPVPIIPKFVDLLVGELMNQKFKVTANAIDDRSLTQFDEVKSKLYANYILKDVNKDIERMTGMPITDKEVPTFEDEEQIEMYLKNTYKQAAEKAIELGLTFVFDNNDIDEIKKRVLRDFITLKWGAIKTYFDANYDIRISYVDPRNLVIPYTTKPDCSDLEYAGEVVKMNFHDLRLINRTLSDDELLDIVKKYGKTSQGYSIDRLSEKGAYYYNDSRSLETFDDFYIDVLDFEFRSSNFNLTYEKKYYQEDGFFLNKKSKGYVPNKESKKKIEVLSKDLEVYYDGMWIVGSDYVVNYELRSNMARPKYNEAYSSKVCSRFKIYGQDIYDMDNKSLVERMIPHADQIQIIHLKIQQFILKAKPSGLTIDVSGLQDVFVGKGDASVNPLELVEIYDQTGNFFYRGTDIDNQTMQRSPIQPAPPGINFGELNGFINLYNYHLDMMRTVSGVNEFRDGSTPDNRTLVGVQQAAIGTSKNTTRPLNEAFISIMNRTAVHCGLMLQLKAKYDKNGLKGFLPALGKETVNILEINKEVSNATLGIKISLMPDYDEMQQMFMEIERAVQTGNIDIEDSLEIRDVLRINTKMAVDLLKQKRKKKQEAEMQKSLQLQQANADAQTQSAMAAAQAEAQLIQLKNQARLAEIQMEYEYKLKLAGIGVEGDVLKEEVRGDQKIKQIKFEKALDYEPEKPKELKTFE